MPPLDPNDPDNLVNLTRADDPPDAPPDDVDDSRSDHQQKDTNVDPAEVLDVGEDAAAGISDPLRRSPPKDYKPKYPDREGFDVEPGEDEI